MRKLLFISIGALLLSACSSSNQISLTQSRYGNGIGISFGNGISEEDAAKTEHFRKVVRERVQHRKFLQEVTLEKRKVELLSSEVNFNDVPEYLSVISQTAAVQTEKKIISAAAKASTPSVTNKTVVAEALEQLESKTVSVKEAKKAVKQVRKASKKGLFDSDVALLLLVILAILLSPLAVYLYEGSWTSRVTLNLILFLLCGLPGVIHALIVILGNK